MWVCLIPSVLRVVTHGSKGLQATTFIDELIVKYEVSNIVDFHRHENEIWPNSLASMK